MPPTGPYIDQAPWFSSPSQGPFRQTKLPARIPAHSNAQSNLPQRLTSRDMVAVTLDNCHHHQLSHTRLRSETRPPECPFLRKHSDPKAGPLPTRRGLRQRSSRLPCQPLCPQNGSHSDRPPGKKRVSKAPLPLGVGNNPGLRTMRGHDRPLLGEGHSGSRIQ